MKGLLGDFLAAAGAGLLVPSLLLGTAAFCCVEMTAREPEETTVQTEAPVLRYTMLMRTGDTVAEQDLDEYLLGVVLAEMPGEFEPEALKAQAVAARTYTCKAYETGGKHGDGSVCTDPGCCQGYIAPEDYLSRGGREDILQKVKQAVEDTSGLVLTWEGELITAAYFSGSGGRTEDAVEVWGTDYPYLVSVESPGEEGTAHYRCTVSFSPEEFAGKLGLTPEGEPESWITRSTYTEAGSVEEMEICGEVFSGIHLRQLLGLRSAAFSVLLTGGEIRITTRGYGHRVGMSQQGAQAMALNGASFARILTHYYTGTEVTLLCPGA